MIADATPYNLGALARLEGPQAAELPWSIVELGLSSVEPQRHRRSRGGADSDRPLDRSVVDRVRATLRRALDRDALPDIPLLCEEEVDRACAPWGLLSEDKQATLVAGIEVAVELAPLDPIRRQPLRSWRRRSRRGCARRPTCCTPGAISPRAARSIRANGRWSTTSPRSHALPEPAVGPAARARRLAGALRRRRRRAVAARGRGAVGEPRPPPADQGDAGIAGGRMRLVADSGLWSTGRGARRRRWSRCWKSAAPCCPGRSTSRAAGRDRPDHLHRCRRAPTGFGGCSVSPATSRWLSAVDGAAERRRASSSPASDIAARIGRSAPAAGVGHWLRRWWPASHRDGIAGLDDALLDVEVAVLTAGAQGFFADDTLDSDVAGAAGAARRGLERACRGAAIRASSTWCGRAPGWPTTSAWTTTAGRNCMMPLMIRALCWRHAERTP